MKISDRAFVEREDRTHESVVLYTLCRDRDMAPGSGSGLGLFLDETRELCAQLQSLAVREPVNEIVDDMRRCPKCSHALGQPSVLTALQKTISSPNLLKSRESHQRARQGVQVSVTTCVSRLSVFLCQSTQP